MAHILSIVPCLSLPHYFQLNVRTFNDSAKRQPVLAMTSQKSTKFKIGFCDRLSATELLKCPYVGNAWSNR